jgi:hypothetical protein
VPFGPEFLCLGGNAAGVFFVEFSLAFQSPPVRGDILFTFRLVFLSRTGRNADKDAGGDGSAESGIIFIGHERAYLVDSNKSTGRDGFHKGVHLHGGGDNAGALAELFTHLLVDFHDAGKTLFLCRRDQFLAPA